MSALSFVVECDGFQHGNDEFSLKCMAVACGRARTTYYRIFNTSALLTKGPDALRTYRLQTLHHGLALASTGLPQSMARPVLIHAILEAFYDLYERGEAVPAQVIIWTKGTQKTALVRDLVNCPGLPCPFLVRNLEDVACPTAKQLQPADPGPLLTQEKALLFSTWLLTEGLDSDPIRRRTL